jgi:hypothetical protein
MGGGCGGQFPTIYVFQCGILTNTPGGGGCGGGGGGCGGGGC